ncbi:MAG: arylsulfatase [Rikenellaceae bacterium]
METILKGKNLILISTAVVATSCASEQKAPEVVKPNVIYILADDMGIGDLGCYGQQLIETPNIDKLAAQGMIFSNHYAGCTVSAPSRSALLSGQHTGHTSIRGNRELTGMEGQEPMDGTTYTIAKMFKDAGYATGAFGKWGLGIVGSEGDPKNLGFDKFYGYNCQREAHRYYPQHIWDNDQKVVFTENKGGKQVVYAPDVIQKETIKFIQDNKDKPFFTYVAIVQPHAELIVPQDEIIDKYRAKIKEEKPYVATQKGAEYGDPDFDTMPYCSQPEARATYAAMVERVDKYVGEIVAELEKQGILDNTLIMFSSDNGVHIEGGADPDFFDGNGPFRGYKRDFTEGGVHVPFIANWNGKIPAGSSSDHVSAFWDMLPTFAEIAGVELKGDIDGISMTPTLFAKGQGQKEHDFLYWESTISYGGSQAVRVGDWKIIRSKIGTKGFDNADIEVYNIKNDVEELNNVAAEHPEIAQKGIEIMNREHTLNPNFAFPLEQK